jgi:hypothetical protein
MTRTITKQQALELFGVDLDHVFEADFVHFSKRDDIDPTDTPRPLLEKLSQFVQAMITVDPSKNPELTARTYRTRNHAIITRR